MGFPFVCFPGHGDSEFPFLYGADDKQELALLRHWLQPGEGFLDCGANIGLYTAAAADALGTSGEAVAVEPGATARKMLTEASEILGNKHVRVVDAAIGDREGETTFYVASGNHGTTAQSIVCDEPGAEHYQEVTVPMRTIDGIVASFSRPVAAVKVDIEGMEAAALAVAPQSISRCPLWIVEVHPDALARFKCRREDVICCFSPTDYEIWITPKFARSGARCRKLEQGETWNDAPFHNLIIFPRSGPFAERTSAFLRDGHMVLPAV